MKIPYRPEIDGLRAIAVISVILYHAQITILGQKFFKGGYLGVDIFFVISGYLITSIVLKELLVKKTFSFKYFYERRVRRILPALLIVMLVSLPLAWIYLLPDSLVGFSKSILYSLTFSSNFYFHFAENQYGAESSLFIPLLHTWSLSLEEQYYIFFPILFYFSYKYFSKYLIHILIVSFFCSLILSNFLSYHAPYINFYILPTRAWELLAGSILAYFELTVGRTSKYRIFNKILPSIGLILITYYVFFFSLNSKHPSFQTLPLIIGVCLIIWFSNKKDLVTKILSLKLFVRIGLISYSLYLWHYPFFAFSRIIDFTKGDLFKKIILGLVILIVSAISYYFIERPARNKKYKYKKIFILIILIIFFITTINVFIINQKGLNERFSNIYFQNNIDNRQLSINAWNHIQDFKMGAKNVNKKEFTNNNKIKILLIGDSHSMDLFSAFILNKSNFKNYEFLRYDSKFLWNYTKTNFNTNEKSKDLIDFENSKSFKQSDVILISNNFFSNNKIEERALKNLGLFINLYKKNKKIILTSNANHYSSKRYKNFYNITLFDYYLLNSKPGQKFIDANLSDLDIEKINHFYFKNRNVKEIQEINDNLKKISKKNNIKFLDKEDFQCKIKIQICYGITNSGFKTNHDPSHFTAEGAKFFGKRIHEIGWLKF
jgi:peptidoglycan/LPS O-acetylase OafA/YrhL